VLRSRHARIVTVVLIVLLLEKECWDVIAFHTFSWRKKLQKPYKWLMCHG